MNKFFNKFKNNKGNSLAEFAVTAAMMATLATTAAPAFSGVADAAKEKQTFANMDRIAGMINQYYSNKSASVGTRKFLVASIVRTGIVHFSCAIQSSCI